ncbi:MAG: fluoride efflux transporter CrcB [Betaproteobacteria bacterium]|nr:fluoride efflux transporter CrcB [Betaproteobacteria bacterium]
MNAVGFIAVGVGAALGAWLRWALALGYNAALPHLPLGTLLANLIGGFLIGVAIEWFTAHPVLAPEIRLFVITGLLGGLTTFSTFSFETVALLQRGEYGWAATLMLAHLLGSIVMTLAGIALMRWLAQ